MIIAENIEQRVGTPKDVTRVLSEILNTESELDRDKEHFWIIGLNAHNVIKFIDLVSLGTLTDSLVHPREVFRLAVVKGVARVIAAHN